MKRTYILKVVVSTILLCYFLTRVDINQIFTRLRTFPIAIAFAVVAIAITAWIISAIRLWLLLRGSRLHVVVSVTFISLFYGTILPGQIAGDLVKAYRLAQGPFYRGHAEAATLVDRAIAVFALFLIGGLTALSAPQIPSMLRWFFGAGAFGLGCFGLVVASNPFRRRIERWFNPDEGRLRLFIRQFSIALHDCLRRPIRLAGAFTLALSFHLLCVVIQVMLGDTLQLPLNWSQWTLIYASVSLVMLLPISVAGIGLREGGYVGMLAMFGVEKDAALAISFAAFGYTFVGALLGGAIEIAESLSCTRKLHHFRK